MAAIGELLNVIGGRLSANQALGDVSGTVLGPVVSDSRKIVTGDVFWAIRGPNHRGETFLTDAFARGAVGAIVGRDRDIVVPPGKWTIRVSDTYQALLVWARWKRQQCKGCVIAVTGSAGKTTTREMIHTVLRSRLHGSASPRNFNNHFGVPLSMTAIEPRDDYAVLELGASAIGEIDRLAELCSPQVGIITCIGDAHLGGFGSRRGVAQAKAELLGRLPSGGHAILADEPLLREMAGSCRAAITWIGTEPHCDVAATEIKNVNGRLAFVVDGCLFSLPVWGRHHVRSALAAIAVGKILGFDLDAIAQGLYKFRAIPMRCEVQQVRDAWLINDAYNANPTAMQAALELLCDFPSPGRRIVVAGDMGELGDQAAELHYAVGRQAVERGKAAVVIACGEYAHDVIEGARGAGMPSRSTISCRTAIEALPHIEQTILPGDVILVKGSRMMAMERIAEALTNQEQRKVA